ncbi:unnamed protein product [Toxocara canis]|uniref:Histidine kinase n=1 Tax=Toxocara canis TaxID=6265 RepID=A0A183UVL2_TOXCA|nr:unnamed protein product [Toxocara canis]
MKNPDAGILYVNDGLIDMYQTLLKDTKNLQQSGSNLDREQIQKVVTKVNRKFLISSLLFVCLSRTTKIVTLAH